MEKQSKFGLFQRHKIEGLQQISGGYKNTTCEGTKCDVSFARNENVDTAYRPVLVFQNGDGAYQELDIVVGRVVVCPSSDPYDQQEWREAPEVNECIIAQ